MIARNSNLFADDLLRLVKRQSRRTPYTKCLEDALGVGPGYGQAWYRSQKEHWVRWLSEYPTAGPYGRKPADRTLAQVVYGRVNCPPMVFWLAETFGVDEGLLCEAHAAALAVQKNQASQSGAIRSVLAWNIVFECIRGREAR